MVTKKDLRKKLDDLQKQKLQPINDLILNEQHELNLKDWEEALKDKKLKRFLENAKELFEAKQHLDDETLNRTGQYRRMSITGTYNMHTTYSDFVDYIRRDYNEKTKANDVIIEARKQKNAIIDEFQKLYRYVDVHTAAKANKFFKEIGLGDVEESPKNEVAVVNVDTNLILTKEEPDNVSQD